MYAVCTCQTTLHQNVPRMPNLARILQPNMASTDVCCCMLQIFETQEMLGLYGKSPTSMGNYYIATGDCGHILTGGTLAGMIISGRSSEHYPHVPALIPYHACSVQLGCY